MRRISTRSPLEVLSAVTSKAIRCIQDSRASRKPTELRNDGELGGSIDSATVRAVERLITHAVGVEITAILVANTAVAVVTVTALRSVAADLSDSLQRSQYCIC